MRQLKKIIFILLIVVAGGWLLKKIATFPLLNNIFAPKLVVIDETPILIKEIKSIGQLITYTAFDEVVADSLIVSRGSAFINSFNSLAPIPILPSTSRQLVLIGRGKILAGTNLQLMTDSAISIKNDTVTVRLPKAQILDAILNPGDFETFVEKGDWSAQEVILVKAQARRKMIDRAVRQNILQKADEKSKSVLENFLRSTGYKEVIFY
jgi:hypothetical protein